MVWSILESDILLAMGIPVCSPDHSEIFYMPQEPTQNLRPA